MAVTLTGTDDAPELMSPATSPTFTWQPAPVIDVVNGPAQPQPAQTAPTVNDTPLSSIAPQPTPAPVEVAPAAPAERIPTPGSTMPEGTGFVAEGDENKGEGAGFTAEGDTIGDEGKGFVAEGDIPPEELGSPTEKPAQTGPNSAEGTVAPTERTFAPGEENPYETEASNEQPVNGSDEPASPAAPAPAERIPTPGSTMPEGTGFVAEGDENKGEGAGFTAEGDTIGDEGKGFVAEGDLPPEELGSPTERTFAPGEENPYETEASNEQPVNGSDLVDKTVPAPTTAEGTSYVPEGQENSAEGTAENLEASNEQPVNGSDEPTPPAAPAAPTTAEGTPYVPEGEENKGEGTGPIPEGEENIPPATSQNPPPAELPEPPAPVTAPPAPAAPAPKTPAATPALDRLAKNTNHEVLGRNGQYSEEAKEVQQTLVKSGVARIVDFDEYKAAKEKADGGVVKDEKGKILFNGGDLKNPENPDPNKPSDIGFSGRQTEAAAYAFQEKSGILNPDGKIGRATAVALKEVANSDQPLVNENGEINSEIQGKVKGAVAKDLMVDGLTKLEQKAVSVNSEEMAKLAAPSSPDAKAPAGKEAAAR